MSILVVGVNHRSGPLPLLERLTIAPDDLAKRVNGLAQRDNIREAVVLSTCNRTEIYVIAERFHGAYADICDFLCELGELDVDELSPHLFSEHDGAAVGHLFEVAGGGWIPRSLGEGEILGTGPYCVAGSARRSRCALGVEFADALGGRNRQASTK